MKFRLGAPGKIFILRVIGQNNSGGEKKNCGCKSPFCGASRFGIKSCHCVGLFYTCKVRLKWNFVRLAMLAALAVGCAGCGGINAGGTISPAMFLLKSDSKPAPGAQAASFTCTNQFVSVK
jgi:hypothetical protein